jgi:hypothetical protein
MIFRLAWRREVRAPTALILWFAFLSWVLLSGLQLNSATRIVTFGYRLSLYAAAGVLFVYVYNLPRNKLFESKALRILVVFWIIVVIGGYAGLLLGTHTFTPPFYHLLPHGIRNKPFIQQLVLPVFAQKESFLGIAVPRPAAPFAYTNDWGGNIAVLTMVAIAAASATRRGLRRGVIIVILALSVVPMVASLNRGMFLSLGIGLIYVTVRLAARGRLGSMAAIGSVVSLLVALVLVTPLGHLVTSSFSSTHGHSNTTRLSLYQQASAGANASPIFGYGAPQSTTGQASTGSSANAGVQIAPGTPQSVAHRLSAGSAKGGTQAVAGTQAGSGSPAIGTQGQLWMILFSNGYPALVLFILFFLAMLWQTRHVRDTPGLWLHAVPLVAISQIIVYGWLPVELQVVMFAGALAYRHCLRPDSAPRASRLSGSEAAISARVLAP